MDFDEELPDFMTPISDPSSLFSSSNGNTKSYKTLPKYQIPSNCSVCHHSSSGHHYDVPSCHGCRAFFRRTVINGTRYTCPKDQDCFDSKNFIDKIRSNCRFCRFEKCVRIGMNPMAIQFEFSENSRKLIAEIWGAKFKNDEIMKNDMVPSSSKLLFLDEIVNKIISKLNTVESVSSKIHDSGLPDGFCDFRGLEDILNSNIIHNNFDIPNLQVRPTTSQFEEPEIYAHCSFLASVEYSKTFDFFEKISVCDKLRLSRHVIVACAALQDAFFSINSFRSDRLMFPNGSRFIKKKEDEKFIGFMEKTLSMMLRNRLDRVEYMLLKAIVLCNPAVCSLTKSAQAHLEKERRQYGFCLLRYCRLQHGAINGPSRYAELLSIIPIVENQVKLLKDLHVYMTITAMKTGEKVCCSRLFGQILDY